MAQQLLVQRGDKSAVPALKQLAASRAPSRARSCTRSGRSTASMRIDPRDVFARWKMPRGTCACRRCGCPNAGSRPDTRRSTAAVLKRLDDSDWNVRRQLAATLGEMRQATALPRSRTLLERQGDDPVTVDAA